MERVECFTIGSKAINKKLEELRLSFSDLSEERRITLVIGRLDTDALPWAGHEEVQKGWWISMGIVDHPFHVSYGELVSCCSNSGPPYAIPAMTQGDGSKSTP